jgi:enamine deaminase RidA (YjgF/YER057c/UK114 family)
MPMIADRLSRLSITLPPAPAPVATYVPVVVTGNVAVVSGQLPMKDGTLMARGKLGDGVSVEQGKAAARQCLLNVLAQLATVCEGDLDRVVRVVRLGGFVACAPGFTEHAGVMNGASDLAVEIFGEAGRHARATIGVASLPMDAAVEIEGLFEIET